MVGCPYWYSNKQWNKNYLNKLMKNSNNNWLRGTLKIPQLLSIGFAFKKKLQEKWFNFMYYLYCESTELFLTISTGSNKTCLFLHLLKIKCECRLVAVAFCNSIVAFASFSHCLTIFHQFQCTNLFARILFYFISEINKSSKRKQKIMKKQNKTSTARCKC